MRKVIEPMIWLLFIGSCAIVVEKDVSNEQLQVIAPSDNVVVEDGNITFRWELLHGATNYELFVVSPGFGNIKNVALDTIFGEQNGHDAEFEPGEYEWSIRALNSAYATATVIRSFSVPDSAQILDISNEIVELLSPQEEEVWTSSNVIFTWQEIVNAESYYLTVVTPSLTQPEEIVHEVEVDNNRFQMTLTDGEYEWEVHAINKYAVTQKSSRSFSVASEN